MSRYVFELKRYQVVVGWDDGLRTFFGQVWAQPEGDDTDDPPLLWAGVSWAELPAVGELAEQLSPFVRLPGLLLRQLERDRQQQPPLFPWQRSGKKRLLLTNPKHSA